MNNEVRDMIGSALHDEPPLRIDRQRVLRVGRRRVRLRRAGVAGGAALGVVAVTMAAVALTGNQAPPGELATGGTSSRSAPAASPAPLGVACPSRQRLAETPGGGPRGTALATPPATTDQNALAAAGRLAQALEGFAFPAPAGVSVSKAAVCAQEPGEGWRAEAIIKAPSGDRTLYIGVRPRGGQPPGECVTFGGAVKCTAQTLPDGTALRLTESSPHTPTMPGVYDVTAWRADGTVVSVMETGTEGADGKPAAPRVLDNDALIKIATAPALRVEWTGSVPNRPAEPSDRRAAELSAVIQQAGILPAGMRADGELEFVVSQGGYNLATDVVDSAGVGHLSVVLSSPGTRPSPEPTCDGLSQHEGVELACERVALPDGRKAIVLRESSTEDNTVAVTVHAVAVDGASLMVSTRNVSGAAARSKNAPAARATRPEPPLDATALTRIAALPGLHW